MTRKKKIAALQAAAAVPIIDAEQTGQSNRLLTRTGRLARFLLTVPLFLASTASHAGFIGKPLPVKPPLTAPVLTPTQAYYSTVQAPMHLSGSVTDADARAQATLSRKLSIDIPLDGRDPYVMETGLNFIVDQPIRYDYLADYGLSVMLPNVVYPGMKFAFQPHVGAPISASVAGFQNLHFGTEWFFNGDIPFDGQDPINPPPVALPDSVPLPGAGTVFFGGNRALNSAPTGFSWPSATQVHARANGGPASAWGVSADLLSAAAQITKNPVLTAADAAGLDLRAALVSDLYRSDSVWLDNFEFSNALLETPTTLAAGDSLALGGDSLGLDYDVVTSSDFDYSLGFELTVDGRGIPKIELLDIDSSRSFFGRTSRDTTRVTADNDDWTYGLRVVSEEAFREMAAGGRPDDTLGFTELEPDVWGPQHLKCSRTDLNAVCIVLGNLFTGLADALQLLSQTDEDGLTQLSWGLAPSDRDPPSFLPPDFPPLVTAADPVQVTASPVPEPGTLALLGFGLAGLGYTRRRKA